MKALLALAAVLAASLATSALADDRVDASFDTQPREHQASSGGDAAGQPMYYILAGVERYVGTPNTNYFFERDYESGNVDYVVGTPCAKCVKSVTRLPAENGGTATITLYSNE